MKPDELRRVLPQFLAGRIADPTAAAAGSRAIAEQTASWDEETLVSVVTAITHVGTEKCLYDAHPALRGLSRTWCRTLLVESTLAGADFLAEAVAAGPTAVICNHQSYIDSNAIDSILVEHGRAELADRFVSAAGPKVYDGLFRRIASASLGTLPVPQSESLGHTVRLPGRELARQALAAVQRAHTAMQAGRVLLIYPEGSRTRTGRMQPFLRAVYRYFKLPGTRIVPATLIGTAGVMAVGQDQAKPSACALAFGPAIDVKRAGGPRAALMEAHAAVSQLLPEALRPSPGDPATR